MNSTDIIEGAMEEYAKKRAFGFASFINENNYTKGKDGWYQYYLQVTDYPAGFSMSTPVYNHLTIEDIYSKYLKQNKK